MSLLLRRPSSYIAAESRHREANNGSLAVALAILALSACVASFGRSAGETSAHFLARHGIALTKEGLIGALSNSDLWIRLGASQQLVLDGEKDAIPFIRAAVGREPRLTSRLTLAFDLGQLGDQSGVDLLKATCSNASSGAGDRVFAARCLLYLHSDSCVSDVLSILDSNIEPPEVIQAVDFFSGFKHVLGSDGGMNKDDIVAHLVKRLGDDDAGVRLAASSALSGFGGASAVAALKEAIERETEEVVKRQMQADLTLLEKKPN